MISQGSGASCIYPLLGAKLNNWHFIATEVDEASVSFAKENVKCNDLENNIRGMDMHVCRFPLTIIVTTNTAVLLVKSNHMQDQAFTYSC